MIIGAMKTALEALEAVSMEMTVGERYTNAGQQVLDAIELLRVATTQQPATGEPVGWRNVIPGGRKTDEWESTRIADYNLGWNAYRKAVKTALEHLETSTQPLPSAWMYTLEYGGTIADTKVSLRQLNYPFGVCGADYLRENSDGISYVRQTPLYTHPAPSVRADVVRDAERYRWLKDRNSKAQTGVGCWESADHFTWSCYLNADEAIDAAMLAAKVGGKQ